MTHDIEVELNKFHLCFVEILCASKNEMNPYCPSSALKYLLSLLLKIKEDHNEELREMREGYNGKVKEIEKVHYTRFSYIQELSYSYGDILGYYHSIQEFLHSYYLRDRNMTSDDLLLRVFLPCVDAAHEYIGQHA